MFNSSDKDLTTKENILNATMELIKTEGLNNITLRKIASCANSNLALINYYFGSKDKLINEALKVLLSAFQEHFRILDDTSIPPKERLKNFMKKYAGSILDVPDLLQELLGKGNVYFESQYEYMKYMKTLGINKIEAILTEITGEKDPEVLMIMMMHLNSAVFFPILMTRRIKDISDVPERIPVDKQIDILFEHYFSQYPD
ncbi:TetR/AcrR family transcriptional regulator [Paenibacillus caui]|uniref:TetR/AcrR family transcriptional regulator n=1 Tax=Paenibacillus caui TaxID=2873927 RepID=UPI001CA94CC8|nr:TetR/AcrR family transcriptional regulator [Paenibacillus caui]